MGCINATVSESDADDIASDTNLTESEIICDKADKQIDQTFVYFLGLSVVITIGLSFIVRRKQRWPGCYWNRPGFLQPLNFVDEIGRRWAYAACFVILTHEIVLLFHGGSHFNLMLTDNEEWMNKYEWVSVFIKLLESMCICLVFYPLLACIDHRHYIAANVVGLLYLLPWIVIYTGFFINCHIQKGFHGVTLYLVRIPIYVALYVIGFSYVLDFIRTCMRIRNRRRKAAENTLSTSGGVEKRGYKIAHHFEYVVNLLQKRNPEHIDETGCFLRAKLRMLTRQAKYQKILGFYYSTRIICCLTVSAAFLLWIMMHGIQKCETIITSVMGMVCTDEDTLAELFCRNVIVARMILHFSNALAVLVILGFLLNTLISYKRRWHQLLRGDHSWHMYGPTVVDPKSTLLYGLKFAGFQTAYAAWGWFVLMPVLSVLFMFLAFILIIPLKNGENNWLIKKLYRLWPTVLLGILIALAQKLICRFCFLQDKGSVMALNNRRVYNAVSYYFLVLNVIVGFFACLKRILIPLILGVTFLSRLDRPLIMSGYETYDSGFTSFVSMLLVDLYHNHPVVKTFVELMLKVRQQQLQQQQEEENQPLTGMSEEDAALVAEKRLRSKLIRNRWLKTVTLVNNPSLAVKVIEKRLMDERRKAELIETLTRKFHQHILDYDGNLIETDSQSLEAQEMIKVKDDLVAIKLQPLNDNTATTTVYKL